MNVIRPWLSVGTFDDARNRTLLVASGVCKAIALRKSISSGILENPFDEPHLRRIPSEYVNEPLSQSLSFTSHPDIHVFRRIRECQKCGSDFMTYEVSEDLIDELVRLRNLLPEMRENVRTASSVLRKLSKSLPS